MLKTYIRKMKGTTKSPPAVNFPEIFWSWTGAFAGIALIGYLEPVPRGWSLDFIG